MTHGSKSIAISLLETAETNLLFSFLKVRPDDVYKQAHPEFNSIMWILGHCFAHFHMVLCSTCQQDDMISDGVSQYFRYGTTKEEISATAAPLTFEDLIDEYLKISESSFSYLQTLNDEDFGKIIFPDLDETLLQSIQRIALHYTGHMGQIVLLRRALGNPGPTFVGGIHEPGRQKMKQEWKNWWSKSKSDFKI
ncbi:MAG: DinB family protein [Candidatus Thorarchaeota archaeon]